jgi:hypothetical protein
VGAELGGGGAGRPPRAGGRLRTRRARWLGQALARVGNGAGARWAEGGGEERGEREGGGWAEICFSFSFLFLFLFYLFQFDTMRK